MPPSRLSSVTGQSSKWKQRPRGESVSATSLLLSIQALIMTAVHLVFLPRLRFIEFDEARAHNPRDRQACLSVSAENPGYCVDIMRNPELREPCSPHTSAVPLPTCAPFGIPSTSPWTGAAIIGQSQRTKISIVMRSRTSHGPMPYSLAELLTK